MGTALFIGLGGLILTGWLDTNRCITATEERLAAMEGRLSRVEGLLEGMGLFGRYETLVPSD